jgi:hypothetical protein
MRHDWNSLITDESAPLFSEFTEDYWPSADLYPRYLERFAEQRGLSAHLRLNANVTEVRRDGPALPSSAVTEDFLIRTVPSGGDPNGAATHYRCGAVIVATGRWTPKYGEGAPMPEWDGSENFEGYEGLNTDLDGYRNKSVLIVGGGNSAFETADAVSGVASFVHVFARSLRFAYQTHYVGDLRATNHEMLDRYLLKSQDALLLKSQDVGGAEKDTSSLEWLQIPAADGGGFEWRIKSDGSNSLSGNVSCVAADPPCEQADTASELKLNELPIERRKYDRIIRCTGWKPDVSIFHESARPELGSGGRFPRTTTVYESVNVPNMFFAGNLMHGRDYRRSSGGFIHGFRYLARSLVHVVALRRHQTPWPSEVAP